MRNINIANEEILELDGEERKHILLNADKYGLTGREVANIVRKIDDDDLKKEILNNASKYNLSSYAILDIVNSIKDESFKNEAYDISTLKYNPADFESKEVKEEQELSGFEKIMQMDDEAKKEVVNNASDYGLTGRNVADIVRSIDDDAFKKEVLNHASDYKFSDYAILDIVNSVKDKEFKQEAYDIPTATFNPEDFEANKIIVERELSELEKVMQKDDESKKEVVNNASDYGFNDREVSYVLRSMADDEFKKQVINDAEKFGFDGTDIATVAETIEDDNFKKELMDNADKYKFTSLDVAGMVSTIEDDEYKKQIIKEGEKYNLNVGNKAEILVTIEDDDFKRDIITGFDPGKVRGVYAPRYISKTLATIDDDNFKNEFLDRAWKYNFSVEDIERVKDTLKNNDKTELHDESLWEEEASSKKEEGKSK